MISENKENTADSLDTYLDASSPTSSSINMCAVCLDSISMPCRLLDTCEHRYCFECLFRWSKIHNSCPLCQRLFTRIGHQIHSDQQLNTFESILTGIQMDLNSKNFTLRKLLRCPKWRDLDNFWGRVVSTGVVCKRKIVFILLIDANKEPKRELIHKRVEEVVNIIVDNIEDDQFSSVIDMLLKGSVNNISVMTLIVCCRKKSKDKK